MEKAVDTSPRPDPRRLAHELRNHLFTISMGIKSLELTRTDPARFAVILEQIRAEALHGVEAIADAMETLDRPST